MHTLYSCTKIFSCFFFLFNKLFFYYNFLKKLKNFFVKPKTNTDRIINVTGFHVRVLSLIHWTTVFRADNMHGAIICDNDAFFWNSSWATWQRLFSRFPSFQKYVHGDLLGFFFIHHRFACEQMYGEKKKKKKQAKNGVTSAETQSPNRNLVTDPIVASASPRLGILNHSVWNFLINFSRVITPDKGLLPDPSLSLKENVLAWNNPLF